MEFKKHNSKIIILTGKAQSGKNISANIIKEYFEKENKKTVILAYARYLKDYAKEIINWNGKEETKQDKKKRLKCYVTMDLPKQLLEGKSALKG